MARVTIRLPDFGYAQGSYGFKRIVPKYSDNTAAIIIRCSKEQRRTIDNHTIYGHLNIIIRSKNN